MTSVSHEQARLQALHDLVQVEAPQSQRIEALVAEAAEVAGEPMASANLLDDEMQCPVGTLNFPREPTLRREAMCDVTLRLGTFLVVEDARADPRFASSPWVDGRLGAVRFYASTPLRTQQHIIGTLCAFDIEPHALTDRQVARLQELAEQVIRTFEAECEARAQQP